MDSTISGVNNFTDLLDKRLLVVLRDGRKLFGILRSYDQFGNLTLEDTIERLYVDLEYAEDNLGPFLVRGENVVLDEEEFRSVMRRMSRFKRSLDQLSPSYREWKQREIRQRNFYYELGATDMTEHDCY